MHIIHITTQHHHLRSQQRSNKLFRMLRNHLSEYYTSRILIHLSRPSQNAFNIKEAAEQAYNAISQSTHPTSNYKSPKAVISRIHDRMSFTTNYKQFQCLFRSQSWVPAHYHNLAVQRSTFLQKAKDLQHFCNGQ
jgi:hypothetical protein